MTILNNNFGLLGLPNVPLTTGINPNAQMPNMGLLQPVGGYGQPTVQMPMPTMQLPQPQQPTTFAQRLGNIGQRLMDFGIGRNMAGKASLDPSSGDAGFVDAMGFQNMQNQARARANEQLQRKQQEFQNQQQLFQNKIAEQNYRINEINLQNRINTNELLKNIDIADFPDQQSFNFALGHRLIKSGNITQGLELIKASRPKDNFQKTKMILSERKEVRKPFKAIRETVSSYRVLRDALKSRTGSGAYTAMIKYIKALDGSVVRSDEVRTFTGFQGARENMVQFFRNNIEGKGFTEKIANDLLNLARGVTANAVKDYEQNVAGSSKTYNNYGLPAKDIYSGFELRTDDLDLFKPERLDFSVGDYNVPEDEKNKDNTIGQINGVNVNLLNNAE
tara:strand:- start:559 stop:1731 length:1173 start_codon:yes stop_codon:yes gene_type:complete